ncbi:MAG: general secretion pathway protein M [Halieaceae bacterium]|jgi:general secretion pathway protein M
MKQWFMRFSIREQLALLLMALAVAVYLLFVIILLPLEGARSEMAARNAATTKMLRGVDAMASELIGLRSAAGPDSSGRRRNLTALLNSSAERFSLTVSRLQPNSRGAVQLRFETVPLEGLLRWLHDVEAREGLLVEELSLSQSATAGIVSASLRVAEIK